MVVPFMMDTLRSTISKKNYLLKPAGNHDFRSDFKSNSKIK